jgi:hypothetical protein
MYSLIAPNYSLFCSRAVCSLIGPFIVFQGSLPTFNATYSLLKPFIVFLGPFIPLWSHHSVSALDSLKAPIVRKVLVAPKAPQTSRKSSWPYYGPFEAFLWALWGPLMALWSLIMVLFSLTSLLWALYIGALLVYGQNMGLQGRIIGTGDWHGPGRLSVNPLWALYGPKALTSIKGVRELIDQAL